MTKKATLCKKLMVMGLVVALSVGTLAMPVSAAYWYEEGATAEDMIRDYKSWEAQGDPMNDLKNIDEAYKAKFGHSIKEDLNKSAVQQPSSQSSATTSTVANAPKASNYNGSVPTKNIAQLDVSKINSTKEGTFKLFDDGMFIDVEDVAMNYIDADAKISFVYSENVDGVLAQIGFFKKDGTLAETGIPYDTWEEYGFWSDYSVDYPLNKKVTFDAFPIEKIKAKVLEKGYVEGYKETIYEQWIHPEEFFAEGGSFVVYITVIPKDNSNDWEKYYFTTGFKGGEGLQPVGANSTVSTPSTTTKSVEQPQPTAQPVATAPTAAPAQPITAAAPSVTASGKYILTGDLNVRTSATTNSKIITVLKKGATPTVLEKTGNWYKIDLGNGKTGFISATYVKETSTTATTAATTTSAINKTVNTAALNVRAGAGANNNVIGVLHRGDAVTVIGTQNGWAKINYNNGIGFVDGNYLK